MGRITRWLGRSDRDIEEEVREHIEMETRENIERGMSPLEAARAAERTFGNASVLRESLRQARPTYWMDTLLQDFRYGVRLLKRSPLLASVIVVTLTFGIGLCSTVFTLLNAELLRAKVDRDPASFLSVLPAYTIDGSHQSEPGLVPFSDYAAYRSGVAELADLAAWDRIPTTLNGDSAAFNSLLVTCNFFAVYGLQHAKLGRLFRPDECSEPGGAPVAVLSEEIWLNRFGADPGIIGTLIRLNQLTVTVVGITPARFSGRNYRETHAWLPYTVQPILGPNIRRRTGPNDYFRAPATPWLQVAGRLRPGAQRSGVQSALQVIVRQQDQLHHGRTTTLFVSDGSQLGDPFRRSKTFWPVILVLSVVTLVLMAVCTNVTLLLLSRAAARQREMAVRLSLGASRFRLVRMLLVESLILAGLAGALSAWLSWRLPEALRNLIGTEPANYSVRPDWISFVYLLGITLLAGCLAGLVPALESLKTNLTKSLKEGSLIGSGAARSAPRTLLVGAQVAISLVLLILACMVLRANLVYRTDPGFDTNKVMAAALPVKNETPQGRSDLQRSIVDRLRGIPGVEWVAFADEVRQTDTEFIQLAGASPTTRRGTTARSVSPEYFQAIGIPIVQGRPFQKADLGVSPPTVAIVSQSLARTLWPGEIAVGKQLEGSDGKLTMVIGVASDLPQSYFNGTGAQLYRPLGPNASGGELLVRFRGDFRPLAPAIRSAISDLDRNALVVPQTLEARVANSDQAFQVLARLVLGLGAMTILLAVVGIYGVVAFAVKQRTRELGIRVALGARGSEIVRLVLASGLKPVAVGILIGLLLAVVGSRVMERAFGNTGIPLDVDDPLTFLAGTLLLSVAAIAAMFGPAQRAGAADPMQALRHE